METVVLDLFGTLVPAPTPRERTEAATRIARVLGSPTAKVEAYFSSTWQVRHDGTLPTISALAAHLVRNVQQTDAPYGPVTDVLRSLSHARLRPDPAVTDTLRSLRGAGLRLGVLSDASAEIAAAWPRSPLAALVDAAVFSCRSGAVKPDQQLYDEIRATLDTPAHGTLYVGDGGGKELRGALQAGMAVLAVRRRGPDDALAFNATGWFGPTVDTVEDLPAYIQELQ
ncbi:HAD family hydrolase [Lipingzhangella sp. LS1_29]|uniref:HAD family hydrolase n=1 Tax=Lipingzhangella rawalii TaxID=2055835 RepID=A0ABU2HBH3_9ACTN|nr:HAD family hydrolase [Lipingzhangella rawalii]MDS1272677.1 HAD family hydrolase [Lipingzhangella rawalii]